MSNRSYWVVCAIVLLFAVAGHFWLFTLPVSPNVELRQIEEFFRAQYVIAALFGIALGGGGGVWAMQRIRHQPQDRGTDYLGRVVSFGFAVGIGAALLMVLLESIIIALWPLGALSPAEKLILILLSGRFLVIPAATMTASMMAFALVVRSRAWGGQYALMPRI